VTLQLRLIALFLLVAAITIREPVLGAAAFILGGATYITAWWTARVERGLRVRHQVPPVLNWGERAVVKVEVINSSLLPVPWLQLVESVPMALRTAPPLRLAFALAAGQTRSLQYELLGSRRGYYHLGPLRLTTGDVLGLHARQLSTAPVELTVYPRVVPLERLRVPAQVPFGPLPAPVRRGEDPARPAGVRPYQASDGVRRVDWKSTARHGDLLVRRSEPTVAPETTLVLAFGRKDYPARILQDCLERGAIAVASFGTALLARKLPVGLLSNGVDAKHPGAAVVLAHGKGDGHRQELLGMLGRLDAGGDTPIWEMLVAHPLPWGGTVVIVLDDLDIAALPQVDALRRRGQHVVAMLLEPTPGGMALARRQRVEAIPVDREGIPLLDQRPRAAL